MDDATQRAVEAAVRSVFAKAALWLVPLLLATALLTVAVVRLASR